MLRTQVSCMFFLAQLVVDVLTIGMTLILYHR